MTIRQRIKQHFYENRWQYILILLFFAAGMLMGYGKVNSLASGVRQNLANMLDGYLLGEQSGGMDSYSIFITAWIGQVKSLGVIYLLGLSVIGLPLILGVIFLRGYSLGFTLGFLIQEKAVGGIVLSVLTILPQHIIYIPFLILWSVIAIKFSLQIVRGRFMIGKNLGRIILSFSLLLVLFMLIFMLGAFVEAYLNPYLLTLVL
ncbi:MAG: stage II sporulation protein M [Syntrophomonadaceae bacterium]|nr:stage II sporulation protein M [Syntrophomonadaceae bacterium]